MPPRRILTGDAIAPLFRVGDMRRLRHALDRLDAVQIGAQLDNMDLEDQLALLQVLPVQRRPDVLAAMRYEVASEILTSLAPEEAAKLLDELDTDDAVDILGGVPEAQLAPILSRLDQEDVDELEELLSYGETTAGGLMSPDVFRVRPNATVGEAIRSLQLVEEPPERAFYVYVVDAKGSLDGVVSLQALVTAPPEVPISEVMETEVVTIPPDMDQEDAADVVSRYDLVTVPVVDDHHRLLGVIEMDDVLDVMREEATEDILKMAGAGEQLVDARSFLANLGARWRWLFAAAVGGILAAIALQRYESVLDAVPMLALFMPVVAGMGGNVGTQSSTIIVRGLAVGFVDTNRVRKVVAREVGVGLVFGLLYGLLIAVVAAVMGHYGAREMAISPVALGIVIWLGTAGSMTIAATVGTCVPLVLERFNVDPAVATGPFVTTSVDVMGLLFYFWLAAHAGAV